MHLIVNAYSNLKECMALCTKQHMEGIMQCYKNVCTVCTNIPTMLHGRKTILDRNVRVTHLKMTLTLVKDPKTCM